MKETTKTITALHWTCCCWGLPAGSWGRRWPRPSLGSTPALTSSSAIIRNTGGPSIRGLSSWCKHPFTPAIRAIHAPRAGPRFQQSTTVAPDMAWLLSLLRPAKDVVPAATGQEPAKADWYRRVASLPNERCRRGGGTVGEHCRPSVQRVPLRRPRPLLLIMRKSRRGSTACTTSTSAD